VTMEIRHLKNPWILEALTSIRQVVHGHVFSIN